MNPHGHPYTHEMRIETYEYLEEERFLRAALSAENAAPRGSDAPIHPGPPSLREGGTS